jgi:hypothetical protein
MLIIFVLSCFLIFVIWISTQGSSALYFGHDIPIVTLQNSSLRPNQIVATQKADVYVVWVDKNILYFTSSHNNGGKFSSQVPLSNNNSSSSSSSSASFSLPQIAATEKGDVYVVWIDKNNLYFTSSHNSGGKFSPQVLLSNNKSSSSASSPQIAATENGDVYVVWVDKNNKTGDTDIIFRNSNDSGMSFNSQKEIREHKSTSSFPRLTATEKGDVYAVWVDKNNKTGDSNIRFISSGDSGKTFNPNKKLTGGKPISFFPQIAATEKGDVYVVWVDKNNKTGDTDITFRNSNDSGMSFDDRKKLRRSDTLLSSLPQIAATEKGDVYVVWTDKNSTSGYSDVSFRTSHSRGVEFGRTINLDSYGNNLSLSLLPQIVTTGNGAYVVWFDSHVQFKQILDYNNVIGQKILLSNNTMSSFSPQLASTEKGDLYAIWIDKQNTRKESLHIKRISEYFFARSG